MLHQKLSPPSSKVLEAGSCAEFLRLPDFSTAVWSRMVTLEFHFWLLLEPGKSFVKMMQSEHTSWSITPSLACLPLLPLLVGLRALGFLSLIQMEAPIGPGVGPQTRSRALLE